MLGASVSLPSHRLIFTGHSSPQDDVLLCMHRTPSLLRHRSATANLVEPDRPAAAALQFPAAVDPAKAANQIAELAVASELTVATSRNPDQLEVKPAGALLMEFWGHGPTSCPN